MRVGGILLRRTAPSVKLTEWLETGARAGEVIDLRTTDVASQGVGPPRRTGRDRRAPPHVLRHTAATRRLAAGGSVGGLMAVAGWTRRDMIDRYTAATAAERAADEARTHGLGDL